MIKNLLLAICLTYALSLAGQDFSANVQKGCAPFRVKFSTASLGNYNWNFGKENNNTSDLREPEVVYDTPGIYTVSLSVNNETPVTKVGYIQVYAPPVPDFSLNFQPGCSPVTVQFENISTTSQEVPVTEYLWVFGDGQELITDAKTLSHVYTLSGEHSVSLTAKNAYLSGCVATRVSPSKVNVSKIEARFSTTTSFCSAPAYLKVANESTGPGPLDYEWSVDNKFLTNEPAPSITLSTFGQHTVSLTVKGDFSCQAQTSQIINVGANSFEITADHNKICKEQSIVFSISNGEYINDWKWNFGNGTIGGQQLEQQVEYKSPGQYLVTFEGSMLNCSVSLAKTITVLERPVADFGYGGDCHNEVTFLNASTFATQWQWKFGDGTSSEVHSPTHKFPSSNEFEVTLTAANDIGCTSEPITKKIRTAERPAVFISPAPEPNCEHPSLTGCAPFNIHFESSVSPSPFAVSKIAWTFGDGQTSNRGYPDVTYTKPGTYIVKLEITAYFGGCIGSTEATVTVLDPNINLPNLVVDKKEVCVAEEVTLKASAHSDNFLCWEVEHDVFVNGEEVKYKFKKPGQQTITLRVPGCPMKKVFTNVITVKNPFVEFSTQQYCPRQDGESNPSPFAADFTNLSTDVPDLVYQWDFGDGTTSNLRSPPQHLFPIKKTESINYPVSLSVFDPSTGCKITYGEVVNIHELTVDFDVRGVPATNDDPGRAIQACKGDEIEFTNKSLFATSWSWDFQDSYSPKEDRISGHENPTKKYSQPGNYNVTLLVGDGRCSLSRTMTIPIVVPDISGAFSFTGKSDCEKLEVKFEDKTTADPPVSRWYWNFGNGALSSEQHPTATYSALGRYNVSLRVGNELGECTVPLRQGLLFSIPAVDFNASRVNACIDELIRFTEDAKYTNKIRWDFDNGFVTGSFSPTTSYPSVGSYTVTAWGSDVFGCEIKFQKENFIKITKPVADFTFDKTIKECPPLVTSFTDKSIDAKSWLWQFGDGETANVSSPVNTYEFPGTYSVTLLVRDENGCSNTKQIADLVHVSGPTGIFENLNPTNCTNDTIKFSSTYQDAVSVQWDFGDGKVEDNKSSLVTHLYSVSGKVQPLVLLRDEKGCEVVYKTTPEMTVYQSPDTVLSFKPETPFTNENISFATEEDALEITWLIGETETPGNVAVASFDDAGYYDIIVRKRDETTGCITLVRYPLYVHGYPDLIPNVFTPNGDELNQSFEIPGLERSSWNLTVYNRWGKNVFESKAYDGNWIAPDLAAGTYFYRLQNNLRPEKAFTGWVQVRR